VTTDPTSAAPNDDILLHRGDGVAVISLNNPRRMNAITPASADHLVEALEEVDGDVSIGVLIVRGEGGTFCSGADLSTLGSSMDDPVGDDSYNTLDRIYRAFTRLGEVGVPTIAAVRGSAVGAGLNLALAADLRIVANDARLMSGFAKIALHPGGGHFQLLVQATNREAATAMGIFSQEISGQRACELGLAWESVDDQLVDERSMAIARAAASDPALARKSVQSMRFTTPQSVPWMAALQAERAPQLWSLRRAAQRRSDH
jgi:enoyl-CoA hydratase